MCPIGTLPCRELAYRRNAGITDYSMVINKATCIKVHEVHQLMSVILASGEDKITYTVIVSSPVTAYVRSKE
jgi:hypothetical protein